MANAYAQTGEAAGIYSGLQTARQRRIDDQVRSQQMEQRDLQTQGMKFDLSQARVGAKRANEAYARSMDELNKRNEEEGVADFVNALNAGVDPNLAMEKFNASGQHQLASVNFSPERGLDLTDTDGESHHFDNPDQFAAAMGITKPPEKPVALSKDERLVTPSGKTLVPAQAAAPGDNLIKVGDALYDKAKGEWKLPPNSSDRYIKAGDNLYDTTKGEWLTPPGGGGEDGRKVSPYNPEGTLQKIEQDIVRSHGGTFDALGNYSVPGDRGIVDVKMGIAGNAFAALSDYIKDGKIGYTEVSQAVLDATKNLSTDSDLEKKAEAWRTEPLINRSDEDKQNWIQLQRQKEMAQAQAKLSQSVVKLMSRQTGKPSDQQAQPQRMQPKPDWAGEEIPAEAFGNASLEYGKEYDVQDEQGRTMTVRMNSDGRIYQVQKAGGGGKAPSAPAAQRDPNEVTPTPQSSNQPIEPDTFTDDEESTLAKARGGGGSSAPEAAAKRAMASFRGGDSPRTRDVSILAGLEDRQLTRLGLSQEDINSIRGLNAADETLKTLSLNKVPTTVY